jgi:hypothetical protein
MSERTPLVSSLSLITDSSPAWPDNTTVTICAGGAGGGGGAWPDNTICAGGAEAAGGGGGAGGAAMGLSQLTVCVGE